MNDMIRAIVKRPDEKYGHMTHIKNDLKNLQEIVEGKIETVSCGPAVIIVNEEGKLLKLQHNIIVGEVYKDLLCGTLIVCGVAEEDFADVSFDMSTWKRILTQWGNAS